MCEQWARTRGMEFAPQKSELLHFTRRHAAITKGVCLVGRTIAPVESARFLGVWLDRKLRWGRHLKEIRKKHTTQQFALTRLAASVWGCSLTRARELYTKVIRAALVYRASAWHRVSEAEANPKGIARHLAPLQSQCLRVVTGGYRATQIRHLEAEAAVPPIDIYLNKRVAEFETRLEQTGMIQRIHSASTAVATRLRQQRGRRPRRQHPLPEAEGEEQRAQWARRWCADGEIGTDEAVERDWELRWEFRAPVRAQGRNSTQPADTDPQLKGRQALKKHAHL